MKKVAFLPALFVALLPVVKINPQNSVVNDSVRENIPIENNEFKLCGTISVKTKSTSCFSIKNNMIYVRNKLD